MPAIEFQGQCFQLDDNENLLDGLLKQKASVPFSCRAGVCHSCLLQVTEGKPPADSQQFLTEKQTAKGFMLACQAHVIEDITVRLPLRDEVPGIITGLTQLSPTEIRLTMSTRLPFSISKGDQVYLVNHEGFEGHYPVADVSDDLLIIECLIERKAGGDPFSAWVHSDAQTGLRLMLIKQN
ncbi:2Fe-2S iron-sulfur cluster-binding protein [Endozoicomonas ascidiicola]|uniref:2Fe-2S iron-sulfur cluster-binding protein n=1 Tax=Endozoicomonas ascidiicola TaxID=1698521 RepID=UPI0008311697|nr:2Fe-2S iron-sulfur cluster-binding protein [Endozoicomonas ascidiicola]